MRELAARSLIHGSIHAASPSSAIGSRAASVRSISAARRIRATNESSLKFAFLFLLISDPDR
ncbi:hypothetical protein [Paraburkholderia sp.]|uniref:hypothetical protein n=1 Tax=Paraburkholderia sp. TaxID=1926495 RepID=UPI00286F8084|nr:hypothetical protein [Paraburkholderia sp.]